jgi:hypothetical protein
MINGPRKGLEVEIKSGMLASEDFSRGAEALKSLLDSTPAPIRLSNSRDFDVYEAIRD